MPWQANTGVGRSPFAYCDRCGWKFRLNQLQMQNGLLLCVTKCLDNTRRMLRPDRIAERLADGIVEARDEAAIKRQEPNIVREY